MFILTKVEKGSDWLNDETIFSIYRDDISKLFSKLQQNKEVQYVTTGNLSNTARLPELETIEPTEQTCLDYVGDIIEAQQRAVMRYVRSVSNRDNSLFKGGLGLGFRVNPDKEVGHNFARAERGNRDRRSE